MKFSGIDNFSTTVDETRKIMPRCGGMLSFGVL
jgi:hypothetical protein